MKKILAYASIIIFCLMTIALMWLMKDSVKYENTITEQQTRINNQSDLIRDMTVITTAYDELIITHNQTVKNMAYIASISPLRNIMTPDEISTLLKGVHEGNIFFTPFVVSAPYGISIGYHGKPRSDHRGVDVYPVIPEDNQPMDMRVKPVADGVVETFGENDVYGKFIIVRYSERVRDFFGHLDKIFYAGTTGRKVTKDTVIGIMGNTGMVFSDYENGGGKHVHYEKQVWDGHTWVSIDPEPFMVNE